MAEDLSAGITLETMETAQTRLAYFVAVTLVSSSAGGWYANTSLSHSCVICGMPGCYHILLAFSISV